MVKFPWRYLILAYALAWLFWIPLAWTGQDYKATPGSVVLMLLGVFGPGIAGIVMTYREQGRAGGRDFWRRATDLGRIRAGWYALILLFFPGIGLTAVLINQVLGGSSPTFDFIRQATAQPLGIPVIVILYLVQAGLEELGWRGYMLERVQALADRLPASLVVGLCHAFWHLPLFWMAGTNQIKMGFGPDFVLFIATVLATSILFTWCYNANGRSTLAVTLFHGVGNLSVDVFMLPEAGLRIYSALIVASALVIALAWSLAVRGRTRAVRVAVQQK